ncbi:hypothetical protein FB446DRAFT_794396 [Lentinula raphanica]|nr:hypothetical protein FB446DRAFT_794396 [Lentinula raphanica]
MPSGTFTHNSNATLNLHPLIPPGLDTSNPCGIIVSSAFGIVEKGFFVLRGARAVKGGKAKIQRTTKDGIPNSGRIWAYLGRDVERYNLDCTGQLSDRFVSTTLLIRRRWLRRGTWIPLAQTQYRPIVVDAKALHIRLHLIGRHYTMHPRTFLSTICLCLHASIGISPSNLLSPFFNQYILIRPPLPPIAAYVSRSQATQILSSYLPSLCTIAVPSGLANLSCESLGREHGVRSSISLIGKNQGWELVDGRRVFEVRDWWMDLQRPLSRRDMLPGAPEIHDYDYRFITRETEEDQRNVMKGYRPSHPSVLSLSFSISPHALSSLTRLVPLFPSSLLPASETHSGSRLPLSSLQPRFLTLPSHDHSKLTGQDVEFADMMSAAVAV